MSENNLKDAFYEYTSDVSNGGAHGSRVGWIKAWSGKGSFHSYIVELKDGSGFWVNPKGTISTTVDKNKAIRFNTLHDAMFYYIMVYS